MTDAIKCRCPACKGLLWLPAGTTMRCPHCGKSVRRASVKTTALDACGLQAAFWQQEFRDLLEEFAGTSFEISVRKFAKQKGIDLE